MAIVKKVFCDVCSKECSDEYYAVDIAQYLNMKDIKFSENLITLCVDCLYATGLGKRVNSFVELEDINAIE